MIVLCAVCAQRLRSMVHEIVGRINGHYGTLTHVPIHHLDRQVPPAAALRMPGCMLAFLVRPSGPLPKHPVISGLLLEARHLCCGGLVL